MNIFSEAILLLLVPIFTLIEILFPINFKKLASKKNIIIVTGWGTSSRMNYKLIKLLEKKGFVVYIFHNKFNTPDIVESANKLREFIIHNKLQNSHLIGISVGAPVCFYYLHQLNGWKDINKFVSLVGTLYGSMMSYLGIASKSARQMIPNSSFIKTMHKLNSHPNKQLYIYAQRDEFVPKNLRASNSQNSKVIKITGHFNLQCFSKEAFGYISEFLH